MHPLRYFISSRSRLACAAALALGATGLSAAVTAAAGPTSRAAGASAFKGHLCRIVTAGELAAAHVSAPCSGDKRSTRTTRTPLGPVKMETFTASWSQGNTEPSHEVSVSVVRVSGSPAAIAYGRRKLRLEILGRGAPVGVGSVASIEAKTSSCVNPPTDDCTFSSLSAIVKSYVVDVYLADAPTGGQAEPSNGTGDDPEDIKQEEADRPPIVAIARKVAAKL